MNKKEAAMLIGIAAANMPNLQNKSLGAAANAWALIMPDISYAEGQQALIKLLREREYPTLPLPGEIIRAIRQLKQGSNVPPTAIEAWEEVRKFANPYKHHDWSHPAITAAVKSFGVNRICSNEYDLSRHFMQRYDALVSRAIEKSENKIVRQISATRKIGKIEEQKNNKHYANIPWDVRNTMQSIERV